MTKEIKLPELGENISGADVINVLVSVGDKISKGQGLLEIETDKATVEVPSEEEGVVAEIRASAGKKINVGDVILILSSSVAAVEEIPPAGKKEEPALVQAVKPADVPQKQGAKVPAKSAAEFKLPELGENITQAVITNVLVNPGSKIEEGTGVLEIETDKATVEVPSDISGIVKDVFVKAGDTVQIGQPLFTIDPAGAAEVSESASVNTDTPVVQAKETLPQQFKEEPVTRKEARNTLRRSEINVKAVPASPSVRRFAREIGIDIVQVRGTGPGGRISETDVKLYAKNINEQLSKSQSVSGIPVISGIQLPDFSKWGEVEKIPMNNIRKKTAEHLSAAWNSVPHVTQFDKADITDLENFRKQYSKLAEKSGAKLTVTAMLIKVASAALKKFPQFNSSVDMERSEIITKKYYNIGIAVDTDRGLIVPVLKDADKKSIIDIAVELQQISERARTRKTSIEEMQGGNFTISNLGGIGGTAFTPIVNSPEVAILGVSRSAYEPVYIDGEFVPRLMLPLSLSYDHRIIDGADGARFLRWIISALEQPMLLAL